MGLQNVREMVDNYKSEYGIEMYINLDHSPTVDDCKQAIDAGYEFIHIDISQGNHDATDDEIIHLSSVSKVNILISPEKATAVLVSPEVMAKIVEIKPDKIQQFLHNQINRAL